MSIVTDALSDMSSKCDYKTVTMLTSFSRGGMKSTPSPALKMMLKINGQRATEVIMENGDD